MNITLDELADGASVYLDANILISCYARESADCIRFVERCRDGRLEGFISTVTLAEAAHKTMTMEAGALVGRPKLDADTLKHKPSLVKTLANYAIFVEDLVRRMNLEIIIVTPEDMLRSQTVRTRYGFLTNDSIVAQVVLDYGIPAFATNDANFDGMTEFLICKPTDIKPNVKI